MSINVNTGTYLDRILRNTQVEVEQRRASTDREELQRRASAQPTPVDFIAALRRPGVQVIAEIKRRSPSKGPIAPDCDVEAIAEEYISGGCAAISVLTDQKFFDGSLHDLETVSQMAHATELQRPILRKDFVIDPFQLLEARACGADAVLLIVSALDDAVLRDLLAASSDLGLTALVEVHDEAELERALNTDAELIGINNRDLRTFEVTLETTERLASLVPEQITLVGESGIHDRDDLQRLERAGVQAVLVGESLMRQPDRARAIKELRSC